MALPLGEQSPQKAIKRRRYFPIRHIQAERHVRSAICLLPTNATQRNCRSYFIVKDKMRGENKKTQQKRPKVQ